MPPPFWQIGYPHGQFRDLCDRAKAAGLRIVSHAGEEGPAEYVEEAVWGMGAQRIDHGVRALEDPALCSRLAAEGVGALAKHASRLRSSPSLSVFGYRPLRVSPQQLSPSDLFTVFWRPQPSWRVDQGRAADLHQFRYVPVCCHASLTLHPNRRILPEFYR